MKNERKGKFRESASRRGPFRFLKPMAGTLTVLLICVVVAAAQGDSPTQLRRFIDQQVGGIAS